MPRSHRPQSGDTKKAIGPWVVLKTEEVFSAPPWVKLSVQQVRLPDGRLVGEYHQIMLPEFVVIVAQTGDLHLIVERQYKHAVAEVTLAFPAGMLEDGEDSLVCAQRELMEETGYASDDWQPLGRFVANGNYGCGVAHLFLARNARWVKEPNAVDLEATEILLMTPHDVARAVRDGDLVVLSSAAAFALATNPLFSSSRDRAE